MKKTAVRVVTDSGDCAFNLGIDDVEIFVERNALVEFLPAVDHNNAVADGVHKLLVMRS